MIEIGQPVATGILGAVAVAVAAWGAWFSASSSRQGPSWALTQMNKSKSAFPILLVVGGLTAVALEPAWLGFGMVYIAAVTWWLTSTVRRSLVRAQAVFGDLDDVVAPAPERSGNYSQLLLAGAGVLAVLSVWDIVNRGWPGIFGLLLAISLGYVGVKVFRR